MFQAESDPTTFLSTSKIERDYRIMPKFRGNVTYPYLNIEIKMTDRQVLHSRQAYNVLDLLGDFGGFNGSVFMLFSFVTTAYSSKMYRNQISQEIPIQRKKLRQGTKQAIVRFRSKFSSVEDSPTLEQSDINTLNHSIKEIAKRL